MLFWHDSKSFLCLLTLNCYWRMCANDIIIYWYHSQNNLRIKWKTKQNIQAHTIRKVPNYNRKRHVLKGGVESWRLQIGVESWLNIWIGVYFNLQWVPLCPAVPEVAQSHVVTACAKRLSGVEWNHSLIW